MRRLVQLPLLPPWRSRLPAGPRGTGKAEPHQLLRESVNVITRTGSPESCCDDVDYARRRVEGIQNAVALANRPQAAETHESLAERLPLFLGLELQALRDVEQLLLDSTITDPREHPDGRFRPVDFITRIRSHRFRWRRRATSSRE
jgi:hypothetical protein